MNKFSKILGGAAIAVVATMSARAIEVKHFEAQIYEAANMEEITKQDPFLTVAIKVFQDSYRAHLDELRAKKNPSDLLRTDNYKYFLTINKVIIEEMVKMAFGIEVTGDSVNYVKSNKDKVIECISGGGNIYKSIEEYDASNWNYLLLINVLNQVKISEQPINAQLIKVTAELIAQQDKYNKYTTQLNNAVHDITEYFNELELYGWLSEVRDSLTIKLENEIVDVQDTGKRMRYINLDICIDTKVEDEADYYAVYIAREGEQTSKYIEYSVKDKEITTYHNYKFDKDALNIIRLNAFTAKETGKHLKIPEINGKSWIKMKHIMEIVKIDTQDYYETPEVIVGLYKKAEIQDLSHDEKILLSLDDITHKLFYICHYDQNYNYDITESFLLGLKRQIEDLETQLMKITDLNNSKKMDELGDILKKIAKKVIQIN